MFRVKGLDNPLCQNNCRLSSAIITKAGWGGGGNQVPTNEGDDFCPVSRQKAGGDLNRPIWEYSDPLGVPVYSAFLGNVQGLTVKTIGRAKTTKSNTNSLQCDRYERGKYVIKGGESVTSKIYFTLELPLIPDNGTLIPTSSIWRERISSHEVLHAEGYQSLKEDYFNNLSRIFCSRNICREGIEFAISEFNKSYSIERYRQCIHYYHRGQPRTQLRPDGTLQYSSLNFYPISSTNDPSAFAICEAYPEPHQ